MTYAPNEKVLGCFSRSFGKIKQAQEGLDFLQAAWAEKCDVPASFCCGEDKDVVEEDGLGTIITEWRLVHIPVMLVLNMLCSIL